MSFFLGIKELGGFANIADPFLHCYLIGKTGTGKSTLLWNITVNAMYLGWGIVVLDGGGDLAENVLGSIPLKRYKDTMVINDRVHFVYNPLQLPYERIVIINNFARAVNKMIQVMGREQAMTSQMREILRVCLTATLDEGGDIGGLYRRLMKYGGKKETSDSALRVAVRLSHLIYNPRINKILTGENEFDFKEVAEKKKIVLIDSRTMDKETFAFIGNLITQELTHYIKRQKVRDYQPMLFICDEFQAVISQDFSELFAQARKCKVACFLAHQNFQQASEKLLYSIIESTGNIIVFQTGAETGKILARQFTGKKREDLRDLPEYYCLARTRDEDCLVKTMIPPCYNEKRANKVLARLKNEQPIAKEAEQSIMRVDWFD